MIPAREFEDDGLGEMEDMAARVLRPPRRISDEDLVASELASAVLSGPLEKIRHVVEAMYLLGEEERRTAGITFGEEEEAGRIYSLSLALLNAHFRALQQGGEVARVVWPFPQKEAASRLSWLGEDFCGDFLCGAEDPRELSRLPFLERAYLVTSRYWVPKAVYQGMVTRFVRWAMPFAARLMRKIMRMVSPDSYREALQLLRGGIRRGGNG